MKLMTSVLIAVLVASSMVQGSDKHKFAKLRGQSVGSSRSRVVVHHDDLLATIVGKEDEASQRLSYTPRADRHDKHVHTPVSLGRCNLLPIVHRGQDVVHLLGTNVAPNSKAVGKVLKKLTVVLPIEKTDQEKLEDAIRSTILAFARQQALTQRSLDADLSPRQLDQ